MSELKCPYCDTSVPADTATCPGCGEDLSGLLNLQYAHVIYYNEAVEHAKRGDLEQALASLSLSLKLAPHYVPALSLRARIEARRGNWKKAREAVSEAIARAPEDDELAELAKAIDQAEEQEQAAERKAGIERTRERRAAAEEFLAGHQRDIVKSLAIGAVVGSLAIELLRFVVLRKRS